MTNQILDSEGKIRKRSVKNRNGPFDIPAIRGIESTLILCKIRRGKFVNNGNTFFAETVFNYIPEKLLIRPY
jgi:hypothetical protein